MTLSKFRAKNHPQQSRRWGASDAVDDRATHPRDFAAWDVRFGGFTIDVAASRHNAKTERYFTRDDNGLVQSWAGERVWCNPPFSDIEPWVRKAWVEHPSTRGIVMILPANRTEQTWWQDLVEPFRDRGGSGLSVEFLRARLRFLAPGQVEIGPNQRPPFGCCLLIWSDPSGGPDV